MKDMKHRLECAAYGRGIRRPAAPSNYVSPGCAARSNSIRRIRTPSALCAASATCSCRQRRKGEHSRWLCNWKPPMLQKKISMLGRFAVGKTSLVKRYVESVFSETYLTMVGMKIDKKTVDMGDHAAHGAD